jgi:hypothetical protein
VNTYAVFAETCRDALAPLGRLRCILPAGIVSDDSTKAFSQALVETECVYHVFHFENEEDFPQVNNMFRFVLLGVCGRG